MFKLHFNVFTATALGKTRSSLTTIGPHLANSTWGQAQLRLYANAANGNLYIEDHQKEVTDRGFGFAVGLVYNSQAKTPEQAWRFSFTKSLELIGQAGVEGSRIILHEADGAETVFNFDAAGRLLAVQQPDR